MLIRGAALSKSVLRLFYLEVLSKMSLNPSSALGPRFNSSKYASMAAG